MLTASACSMLNLQTRESVKDQDLILISESKDKINMRITILSFY